MLRLQLEKWTVQKNQETCFSPCTNHTEELQKQDFIQCDGVISGNDEYFKAGLKYYLVALKLTRKDGSSPWEIRKQEKKEKMGMILED